MRTKLSLLLCLGIAFVSCKKGTVLPPSPSIEGTWELRATRGGNIAPATYNPGNGHLLILGNSTFNELVGSDASIDNGTYVKSATIANQYSISDVNHSKNLFIFKTDTLQVTPKNPDASTSFYVKISNYTLPMSTNSDAF